MATENLRSWFLLWQANDLWRFKNYQVKDRTILFTLQTITGYNTREYRMDMAEDETKIMTCTMTPSGSQAHVLIAFDPCATSKPRHQEIYMSSIVSVMTVCSKCHIANTQFSKFCNECGSNLKDQAKKVNKYLQWCGLDLFTTAKRLLLGKEHMTVQELDMFNLVFKQYYSYHLEETDDVYTLYNSAGAMSKSDAIDAVSKIGVE